MAPCLAAPQRTPRANHSALTIASPFAPLQRAPSSEFLCGLRTRRSKKTVDRGRGASWVERRRIALPRPHRDRYNHPPLSPLGLSTAILLLHRRPPSLALHPPHSNWLARTVRAQPPASSSIHPDRRAEPLCTAAAHDARAGLKTTPSSRTITTHISYIFLRAFESPCWLDSDGRSRTRTTISTYYAHLLYVHTITSLSPPPLSNAPYHRYPALHPHPSPGTYNYSTVCSGIRRLRSPQVPCARLRRSLGPQARPTPRRPSSISSFVVLAPVHTSRNRSPAQNAHRVRPLSRICPPVPGTEYYRCSPAVKTPVPVCTPARLVSSSVLPVVVALL